MPMTGHIVAAMSTSAMNKLDAHTNQEIFSTKKF